MTRLTIDDKISFTRYEAAEATGLTYDTISAAVRSGDLREIKPEVNGRRLRNGVILRADLEAWLRGEAA